jgi:hypothetical protein
VVVSLRAFGQSCRSATLHKNDSCVSTCSMLAVSSVRLHGMDNAQAVYCACWQAFLHDSVVSMLGKLCSRGSCYAFISPRAQNKYRYNIQAALTH